MVLFCHITSKIAGAKDGDLLQKKGGQGFPHIVFMDSDGGVLAEHNGPRDAAGFAKTGEKAATFLDLKAKAAKGDKAAQIDVLLIQLEMESIEAAQAEKQWAGLKPSPDQAKRFEKLLSSARIMEIARAVRSEEEAVAAGKAMAELKKAGKPIPDEEPAFQAFWVLLLKHAEAAKDAALFEEAFGKIKEKYGANPGAQNFIMKNQAVLDKLKAEAKPAPEKK